MADVRSYPLNHRTTLALTLGLEVSHGVLAATRHVTIDLRVDR